MAGAKETPRQKMIGMMYLVLTALLALNISKEVLNGFVKVENSLRSTQLTIADKVDETYSTLKAKYLNNQEKVGPFYEKAEVITEEAEALITYISKLKARCMSTSEGDYEDQELVDFEYYYGVDLNGRDTVLNLKHIQKKDEYTALTTFMVGSEPSQPHDAEWSAHSLRLALEKYRDDLINMSVVDIDGNERTLPENIKNSLKERFSFENEIENDVTVLWEAANFYDVPLAAVMPLMSKIIIDVEDAEEEALAWLLGGIEAKSLKFSEVMPLVIPQSNYIIKGDTARASILLAAFDPTRVPEVYVEGTNWNGVDSSEIDYASLDVLSVDDLGQGQFAFSTRGMKSGQYSYRGVIRYQGPDGDMQSQDFVTPTFTVAEAALVVSPIKMNVFYRGLPNPVEVSVPGVANDKLRVSISSGHKIRKQPDGSYIVEPSSANANKTAKISVKGEMPDGTIANLGSADFRVKRIPDPVPFWSGKRPSNRTISKNEVLSFAPLAAKMENFDFDVKVRVKSFTIRVSKDGTFKELNSGNNRLTADMKALLERVRRGNTIYFEDIVVGMPDGTERILSPMKLKVTS
jgi:gliding motility-associated protein GldM